MVFQDQRDIYFAHPYYSWGQRLNENRNGLLRQYFPKNMKIEFAQPKPAQLKA